MLFGNDCHCVSHAGHLSSCTVIVVTHSYRSRKKKQLLLVEANTELGTIHDNFRKNCLEKFLEGILFIYYHQGELVCYSEICILLYLFIYLVNGRLDLIFLINW